MPLGKKDPDEIANRHTHTRTVQCNMQFDYSDYSSGRLDFRSQLFLRPIATVSLLETALTNKLQAFSLRVCGMYMCIFGMKNEKF